MISSSLKAFLDRLAGVAQAVLLVMALLGLLHCAGCANGVHMTDEEAIACRDEGCVVYTEREQLDLVTRAARAGYTRGWSDAIRQAGKDL